jgi:hypothetical protein
MNKLSIAELSYIAGIVDGEGCICIRKISPPKGCVSPSYSCYLKIATTDKILANWLKRTCGIGCICVREPENKRTNYNWEIAHQECRNLLEDIYSFLVIKKKQADIIFKFRKTFSTGGISKKQKEKILSTREECFIKLKELHQ